MAKCFIALFIKCASSLGSRMYVNMTSDCNEVNIIFTIRGNELNS